MTNSLSPSLLCVDLGASAIKAGVFDFNGSALEIKGYGSVPQNLGNIQGGMIVHLKETIENTQEAVKKAENMARKLPLDLVLGVSGETVKGMTVSLDFTRPKPDRPIDDQELKSIVYELQWQAHDLIRRAIAMELCIQEVDLKLMNASIMTIRVDQEIIDDPRGRTGQIVSMDIFNSFSPLTHFGHLQTIALELPYHRLKGVLINSFSVAYAITLQNALLSAVVIDIGAGGTDLCVVSNGRIIGNRSFSLGGNAITKRISRELATSFEEAEGIKIGFAEGNLDKKSSQVIEEAILPDLDLWISSIEFSLKELPMKFLPNTIIVSGQGSRLSHFKTTLQDHAFSHHFPLEGDIEIKALDYPDLTPSEIISGHFEKDYLSLVALGVAAEDLLYRGEMMEEILNGVIADKAI